MLFTGGVAGVRQCFRDIGSKIDSLEDGLALVSEEHESVLHEVSAAVKHHHGGGKMPHSGGNILLTSRHGFQMHSNQVESVQMKEDSVYVLRDDDMMEEEEEGGDNGGRRLINATTGAQTYSNEFKPNQIDAKDVINNQQEEKGGAASIPVFKLVQQIAQGRSLGAIDRLANDSAARLERVQAAVGDFLGGVIDEAAADVSGGALNVDDDNVQGALALARAEIERRRSNKEQEGSTTATTPTTSDDDDDDDYDSDDDTDEALLERCLNEERELSLRATANTILAANAIQQMRMRNKGIAPQKQPPSASSPNHNKKKRGESTFRHLPDLKAGRKNRGVETTFQQECRHMEVLAAVQDPQQMKEATSDKTQRDNNAVLRVGANLKRLGRETDDTASVARKRGRTFSATSWRRAQRTLLGTFSGPQKQLLELQVQIAVVRGRIRDSSALILKNASAAAGSANHSNSGAANNPASKNNGAARHKRASVMRKMMQRRFSTRFGLRMDAMNFAERDAEAKIQFLSTLHAAENGQLDVRRLATDLFGKNAPKEVIAQISANQRNIQSLHQVSGLAVEREKEIKARLSRTVQDVEEVEEAQIVAKKRSSNALQSVIESSRREYGGTKAGTPLFAAEERSSSDETDSYSDSSSGYIDDSGDDDDDAVAEMSEFAKIVRVDGEREKREGRARVINIMNEQLGSENLRLEQLVKKRDQRNKLHDKLEEITDRRRPLEEKMLLVQLRGNSSGIQFSRVFTNQLQLIKMLAKSVKARFFSGSSGGVAECDEQIERTTHELHRVLSIAQNRQVLLPTTKNMRVCTSFANAMRRSHNAALASAAAEEAEEAKGDDGQGGDQRGTEKAAASDAVLSENPWADRLSEKIATVLPKLKRETRQRETEVKQAQSETHGAMSRLQSALETSSQFDQKLAAGDITPQESDREKRKLKRVIMESEKELQKSVQKAQHAVVGLKKAEVNVKRQEQKISRALDERGVDVVREVLQCQVGELLEAVLDVATKREQWSRISAAVQRIAAFQQDVLAGEGDAGRQRRRTSVGVAKRLRRRRSTARNKGRRRGTTRRRSTLTSSPPPPIMTTTTAVVADEGGVDHWDCGGDSSAVPPSLPGRAAASSPQRRPTASTMGKNMASLIGELTAKEHRVHVLEAMVQDLEEMANNNRDGRKKSSPADVAVGATAPAETKRLKMTLKMENAQLRKLVKDMQLQALRGGPESSLAKILNLSHEKQERVLVEADLKKKLNLVLAGNSSAATRRRQRTVVGAGDVPADVNEDREASMMAFQLLDQLSADASEAELAKGEEIRSIKQQLEWWKARCGALRWDAVKFAVLGDPEPAVFDVVESVVEREEASPAANPVAAEVQQPPAGGVESGNEPAPLARRASVSIMSLGLHAAGGDQLASLPQVRHQQQRPQLLRRKTAPPKQHGNPFGSPTVPPQASPRYTRPRFSSLCGAAEKHGPRVFKI